MSSKQRLQLSLNEMNRGTASFVYFTILVAAVLLLTACSESDPATATPSPTVEAEATSSAEETVSSTEDEQTETEIFVKPTLAPTPTPGPVDNLVADLVEDTVIADFSFLGLSSKDWINLVISLLVVLLGYIVIGWLIGVALRWFVRRSGIEIAAVFLKKIGNQLRWLLVIFLAVLATFRLEFLGEPAIRLFGALYFTLALWIVVYIVWEQISYSIQVYEGKITAKHGDSAIESMLPLLQKTTHFTLLLVAVIIWLDNFGVNVTALIAALGIAGFALSLAAQDTIADAISGLVILLDQPFRVADQIEIEEIGTYADVIEIGMRTTRLRTKDNRLVIMPNSLMVKNQVVNYTFPDPTYRLQAFVGVAYGTDIDKVLEIMIKTVRDIDGVLPDKPVDARYNEMGNFTMIIRVRWWVESVDDPHNTVGVANKLLQETLDAAGIEMPFPTQTMNLEIGDETAERLSRTMTDNGGG